MNPQTHRWPAPAKLNLMLRVVGKRTNGYHQLQTVFQFIDYCDWLQFRLRGDGKVSTITKLPGIDDSKNLAIQAALLLQHHSRIPAGVDIHIEKRLPMGGGLGGGSSNAATTLLVLNHLWGIKMPRQRLGELGVELGADVPIFVHGRAAWAEGIGEQLHPIDPEEPWYLIIDPGVQVPTAEIFHNCQLTRDAKPIKIRDFLAGNIENTIEPLVSRLYPEVGDALEWLQQYTTARMSGTGASVFGRFNSKQEASKLLSKLPRPWRGFVARGCNQSPLHRALEKFTGAWPSG